MLRENDLEHRQTVLILYLEPSDQALHNQGGICKMEGILAIIVGWVVGALIIGAFKNKGNSESNIDKIIEQAKKDGKIKPMAEHSATMKASTDTIRLGTESWEEYKRDYAKLNKSQQEYELDYFKKKLHKRFRNASEDIKDQVDEAIRELELIYRA